MYYRCNKCKYIFEVVLPVHPHPINSFISVSGFGCPICLKANAKEKICPNCGSNDLKMSVRKEELNNEQD